MPQLSKIWVAMLTRDDSALFRDAWSIPIRLQWPHGGVEG